MAVRHRAYEVTGEWQNRLCLAEPVDATRRQFFDRAFQVIDAGRFADAWFASIGDTDVAALPESEDVEDGAQDPVHFEHLGRTGVVRRDRRWPSRHLRPGVGRASAGSVRHALVPR